MNEPASQILSPPVNATDEQAFIDREGSLHLIADWVEPVFIHYRIDPQELQPHVPYELDLCEDSAWVSLVAFTMKNMRPNIGGRLSRWMFSPFREQRFLNVRTYVKHGDGRGIHFIAEWISDWMSSKLGPRLYCLPYRHARLEYRRDGDAVNGTVRDGECRVLFRGRANGRRARCQDGSKDAFLLERYTAFNAVGRQKAFFRVWHEPWIRANANVEMLSESLLRERFEWWPHVEFASAHVSEGVFDVRMGRPRQIGTTSQGRRVGASML